MAVTGEGPLDRKPGGDLLICQSICSISLSSSFIKRHPRSLHAVQKKELFRLQAFITSLFQKSEADMIKDIFVMYDTDGSGGIDEDELCAGLTASGGGPASSPQVTSQVAA